ncbi:hypothetical protein [Campylobacter vulpis]|uniref:hypothetical protein n=1 Tax=Campylobacter vulpis TaxID=1655500 RepID=UPI000C1598E4|nr:hypothetical protein [Campylobacter vulpis]MBS4274937.1 hypothetical protein [Campylobacter vulpis]MBS4306625.1 hypothetical protein [Campylobacter vulpis]MBS4329399.1 hypothetical protein [Campylobacter vulpis]MBS4422603.1 hypothetical protein [Campylobacter vulpis]PHY91893.1 hypothetical protein AA995_02135 [Campylobacter vulpis]
MKKYALIGILSVLTLILLIVVFILLWNFKSDSDFFPQFIKENNATNAVLDKTKTWQQELAMWPVKDFTPAAEQFRLYFDADTSELKEKNKYYQLIINKYDIYSMFCLRQTLDSFKVKYFLLKSVESPQIFLDTDNQKLIEEIINELKKYKINTQAKEIWL